MELLKMRGFKFIVIFLTLINISIFSIEDNRVEKSLTTASAYYFPDNQGFGLSSSIAPISYNPILASTLSERDLGSTWGGVELQETFKLSLTKKILTGESFLTADNNIKYTFISGITPVNVEIGGEVTLTPIAFLNFSLGSTIATGWTAIGIVGLGLNNIPGEPFKQDPFQGVLSQTWLTGTFQFDTAAILSGDKTWKHIIILSSHKITNKFFSAAGENDPWTFQGSEGNKYNGLVYNHTSVIAYQMPLVLEMAGLLVETECNILNNSQRSKMLDGGWGSDFLQVRFGGIFNFKFNDHSSLAILPQLITRPHYTDSTVKEAYFSNRVIDTQSPTYIDFDRIAFSYSYKF